jgi:hypothetical protein
MSATWKAALGILLVFALGCVSGALSTSVFFRNEVLTLQRNPEEVARILENRFTRHLDVDSSQHAQIHQILLDYLQSRRQLNGQIQPQMQALNQQMIGQIKSVLRPDQVAGFKDNITQLRRRMARSAFRPPEMNADQPAVGNGSATNAAPVP